MTTVKTVVTDTGEVITGAEVDTSPSIGEIAFGFLCPPVGALMLAESLAPGDSATVKWNGETYTGKVIK